MVSSDTLMNAIRAPHVLLIRCMATSFESHVVTTSVCASTPGKKRERDGFNDVFS